MTGYGSEMYVRSLAEFGDPVLLPHADGWILERPIGTSGRFDAMGCYPLFACRDWQQLQADLDPPPRDLVSLVLVTDPFGDFEVDYLKAVFTDLTRPFKEHFVTRLPCAPVENLTAHHVRNVRYAEARTMVTISERPLDHLDEWCKLYENLVQRHGIRGIAVFSRQSFEQQLQLPGLTAFIARQGTDIVGISLWLTDRRVAYYHLAAYNQTGYECKASFSLFATAREYFSDKKLDYLSLGAGAGLNAEEDGLTRFKRGWSTETRMTYLCGRIIDLKSYDTLVEVGDHSETTYFPAYRAGDYNV